MFTNPVVEDLQMKWKYYPVKKLLIVSIISNVQQKQIPTNTYIMDGARPYSVLIAYEDF